MDIVSHGLWGALLAKAVNVRLRRKKVGGEARKLDPLLAGFWGFAPDLVAFTPIFLLFGGGMLSGHLEPENFPRPTQAEAAGANVSGIFWLTHAIYSVTHSAVVFVAIFFGVWAFRKFVLKRRYPFMWELTPWALHLLMDLPTHSYRFYPTPILWPISEWRFDGIPWSTPWIFAANYIALALGFYLMHRRRRRVEAMEAEAALAPAVQRVDR